MKVTQVESQKKNPHRFNIYLDGKYAFGADADTVVNYRLVLGKEIDAKTLDKLIFEVEVGKLMERMYGLFNVRGRSEKEVRDYLKRLQFKRKVKGQDGISEVVIENLIERLKSKGLLNDIEFAKAWVEARRKSKNKGKIALKSELYKMGIKAQVIEQSISINPEDEEKLAMQALEKKLKTFEKYPPIEFKQKALSFLMRRGFDYDTSRQVVESFVKKEYNT